MFPNHIKCTIKNPNLRGEENINLTVEYLQEKVSFQPDLGEEEDNKVCFEYFRIYFNSWSQTVK